MEGVRWGIGFAVISPLAFCKVTRTEGEHALREEKWYPHA